MASLQPLSELEVLLLDFLGFPKVLLVLFDQLLLGVELFLILLNLL